MWTGSRYCILCVGVCVSACVSVFVIACVVSVRGYECARDTV